MGGWWVVLLVWSGGGWRVVGGEGMVLMSVKRWRWGFVVEWSEGSLQ